jgi:hypothetical protein
MRSPRVTARLAGPVVLVALLAPAVARGQGPVAPAARVRTPAESRLLQALAADPRTAPFGFGTELRDGRVVLHGRVGSASFHAAAVAVAVDTGIPFTDRLVIDTAEMARVPRPAPPPLVAMPYPYPLFTGPFDPFLGLEPPLITYPPWWGAMSARRLAENAQVDAAVAAVQQRQQGQPRPPAPPPDAAGAVMPGNAAPARPVPPPPTPGDVDVPPVAAPPAAAPAPLPLSARVEAALRGRPELAGRAITATNRGGDVTLSGNVPDPPAALAAFAAARRTPGVERVVDGLRYPVPPPERPNPLLAATATDDLAAFLRHHVERQFGDAATVRALDVAGGRVRLAAALAPGRDAAQVGAVLRSMPMLRGFALDLDWQGGGAGAR